MTDPQQWQPSDPNGLPQQPDTPPPPAPGQPYDPAALPPTMGDPPPPAPADPVAPAQPPPGYGAPPPNYGQPVPPPQAAPPPKSKTGLIIGVVVGVVALCLIAGVVGGVVYFVNVSDSSDTSADSAADGGVVEPEAATEDFAVVLGSGDPVVHVYADFICPACKSFDESYGAMLYDAADNGEVTLRIQPMGFLDSQSTTDYSTRAAAASVCAADADGFREYSEALFANQPQEGGEGHDDAALAKFGEDLGLDGQFSDCVANGTYVGWIGEGTEHALSQDVASTPTVLVDGEQIDPTELENALSTSSQD